MRKVIMFNSVSLDGYYAGPNGEIDWFTHDPEVDNAAHQMMNPDTIIFGKTTYQMFEGYWPHVARDSNAPENARIIANELNQMSKVIFSTTLQEVTWENSVLFNGNLAEEVKKLKQQNSGDITIFGSGTIVQQLEDHGLINEYIVKLIPVILGTGKSLFHHVREHKLKLIESKAFRSGVVILHYKSRD
jgi:dihydrofolate reductase